MTLIGAGVQILTDRRVIESFTWRNKERLFRIFRELKVQNVVLLSGDVHMAQLYESKCRSVTGMNTLVEVTSSGLSHS